MHCGGRRAFLRCDEATYVHMPFICCTEKEIYARHVAAAATGNLSLADDSPLTHSIKYVAFTCPYGIPYFLTNAKYWLKQIIFEQMSCDWKEPSLLANYHRVDIFEIQTRQQEDLSVQVLSGAKVTRNVACFCEPTRIVFAHHSSSAFLTERRSLLFRIVFAEHCVYALITFFSSSLVGEPSDASPDFEVVTTSVESGVFRLL